MQIVGIVAVENMYYPKSTASRFDFKKMLQTVTSFTITKLN